jgi:hypothetical protein
MALGSEKLTFSAKRSAKDGGIVKEFMLGDLLSERETTYVITGNQSDPLRHNLRCH